jgi:hypothetical protein
MTILGRLVVPTYPRENPSPLTHSTMANNRKVRGPLFLFFVFYKVASVFSAVAETYQS